MRTPHPRRVQARGNRFNLIVPAGAVWAGGDAPGREPSAFRNPHAVNGRCKAVCGGLFHTVGEALALYAVHLDAHPEIVRQAATEPAHVRFACRCPLDEPCHVDELLRRVDELRAAA